MVLLWKNKQSSTTLLYQISPQVTWVSYTPSMSGAERLAFISLMCSWYMSSGTEYSYKLQTGFKRGRVLFTCQEIKRKQKMFFRLASMFQQQWGTLSCSSLPSCDRRVRDSPKNSPVLRIQNFRFLRLCWTAHRRGKMSGLNYGPAGSYLCSAEVQIGKAREKNPAKGVSTSHSQVSWWLSCNSVGNWNLSLVQEAQRRQRLGQSLWQSGNMTWSHSSLLATWAPGPM